MSIQIFDPQTMARFTETQKQLWNLNKQNKDAQYRYYCEDVSELHGYEMFSEKVYEIQLQVRKEINWRNGKTTYFYEKVKTIAESVIRFVPTVKNKSRQNSPCFKRQILNECVSNCENLIFD
jgi:hypothetical protein